MQVVVITVGKVKERYWNEALAEYAKRLSGYVKLDLIEVPDEPAPETFSESDKQKVMETEAANISKHLRDRDGIIVLDIGGRALSSEAWSEKFVSLSGEGYGRLVFVIGGSLGLSDEIRRRAAFRWSFGPITLPHQLARIVLLEQLYRGIRIARGEPYHK